VPAVEGCAVSVFYNMKQKKSTKKFLKNAAKPKHGKEQQQKPKKAFGKPKPGKRADEAEFVKEDQAINLKQPTAGKGKGSVKG
jgi:hypothetical protein